jgi:hypothetical protein
MTCPLDLSQHQPSTLERCSTPGRLSGARRPGSTSVRRARVSVPGIVQLTPGTTDGCSLRGSEQSTVLSGFFAAVIA